MAALIQIFFIIVLLMKRLAGLAALDWGGHYTMISRYLTSSVTVVIIRSKHIYRAVFQAS